MNDEQRQLAIQSLQSDIESLRKYNNDYEGKIREHDAQMASLASQKTSFERQIQHNVNLIGAFEAAIALLLE